MLLFTSRVKICDLVNDFFRTKYRKPLVREMSNSEAHYSRAAGALEVGPAEPHRRGPAAATADSGTWAPGIRRGSRVSPPSCDGEVGTKAQLCNELELGADRARESGGS